MTSLGLGDVSEGRDNNFDQLRLVLALLVIFSHSFPLLLGDDAREPLSIATRGQCNSGQLAVNAFFILSGFLITRSWLRGRGLGDFLKKRALRIYPGFVVAVLFCAFVAGPLGTARREEYWSGLRPARLAFGIANLAPAFPPSFDGQASQAINGSLWSIRFEFLCYLLVPALGAVGLLRRRNALAVLGLGCLAVHVAQIYAGLRIPGSRFSALYGYPPFWPRVGTAYLSGVLFYLFRDRVRLSAGGGLACLLWLAAASRWGGFAASLPVAGAYLLFCAAYWPTPGLRGVTRGNDISYGLYLYGFPVQQLLIRAAGSFPHPTVLFLAAAAVAGVIGTLSWRIVEKPFLRLRPPARPPATSLPANEIAPAGRDYLAQGIHEGVA